MEAYENPKHRLNGKKYHTKKKCVERGCQEIAGTAWSPYWCQKHNAQRLSGITAKLESFATIKRDEQGEG